VKIDYRFDPDYSIEGRHYAHPLIYWPTILAGAAVSIALGAALSMFGVAIGAATFNPFQFNAHEDGLSWAAAIYMLFAHLVAFQIGAYVAARAAPYPDHFGGALTGLVVWASATVFAMGLFSLGALNNEAIAIRILNAAQSVRAEGSSGELSAIEAAADATATFAWIGATSLFLGAAGAIAGGWLGATHPLWEGRPRVSHLASQR
jgi:hypothetical protein